LKTERADQGNWRQRWDRFRARELEEERKREASRRRVASLNRYFIDWLHARNVREFVGALEKELQNIGTLPHEREQSLLNHVREYLDSVDPMQDVIQLLEKLESDIAGL
jgi:hypothetical protein